MCMLLQAEDGPPSVAPREADVSVNDADVSTAARQLDVGELVGALLRGPSEAEHSINVPDSATANLAKQAGGGAGNFGVPDPVGEVSTEPVRREPLLSDAAPKSGASGFWTLTESLADVRAGGPELSEGLKSKAGLHRDDGRSPIGVLVSDVGCRASETDTSNRGPSLNGRPDSERELNLGEVLALVAGLHLKRAVISDDGIAADRGLKPNGCLRSHESDGVPNADVVQKLGEGPLSDGAVKEPHSDAGVNTNGALRAAEKREVDQGLDMDRLRTADGALDSDEEFTADGGLDSDEGVIADGGRDSDEGFTADGGLDSDVGPRAAEGRNVSKRPTEEEKMSTVRGLVSDEKVDGWEGHNSDGGLNSDALRTEVQKSAEELRSRLFSDNAQVSDKTAERSDSRQGLTRNGREHSDEATDSDEATKGSGGKGRERTERGAARDASDTHQASSHGGERRCIGNLCLCFALSSDCFCRT